MMLTKALLSVSLLDIKELQSTLLKNSFFDVSAYAAKLIEIVQGDKPEGRLTIDVEKQISQYQFFEHEYKENQSFYSNLRSMRVLLFFLIPFWVVSFVMYMIQRKNESLRANWKYMGIFKRFWGYMGSNALIRILFLQYIMVLYAGFVVFRVEVTKIYSNYYKNDTFDYSGLDAPMFMSFTILVLAPLIIAMVSACQSKEKLREEYVELSFNTLYYKANLKSTWSKAYPLVFLIQRIAIAFVVMFVEDIVI